MLKKLCSGPVKIDILLKNDAEELQRTFYMDEFSQQTGLDDAKMRVSIVMSSKFAVLGDVYIFQGFAGAQVGAG